MPGTPPQLPPVGWQHALAAALTAFVTPDPRVQQLAVYGSAADRATIDRWSDLDVLITAGEPAAVLDTVVRELAEHHAPVFASSRGGGPGRCTARLVLCDLRRVDITVADQAPASSPAPPDPDVHAEIEPLLNEFRFDAVLAAVKAAREDLLIGAHLTLGLARHVLVAAMVLRNHDKGTVHHRHGGSRQDEWAVRLASAPTPYDRAGLTAAIRFYAAALEDLLADHGARTSLDHGTLAALLDAVDGDVQDDHG